MKIIDNKKIRVYVYPNDHPPPHCHVRYNDGSEVSVDIPLIMPRYDATISKDVSELIQKNLDRICITWEKLNQPRKTNIQKRRR